MQPQSFLDLIHPPYPRCILFSLAISYSKHDVLFHTGTPHHVPEECQFQLKSHCFCGVFFSNLFTNPVVAFLCCPWYSEQSSPAPIFKRSHSFSVTLLYSLRLATLQCHSK